MKNASYIKCVEVFDVLTAEGTALLVRHGEDAITAERGGKEFALCVVRHFSGQIVYFPKFIVDVSRKRLAEISEDAQANRQSASELARKHGISMTVAYQIIKQTKDLASNSRDSHYVTRGISIEIARMLIKHGVEPRDAVVAARGFAGVLVSRWGGKHFSFPRFDVIQARQRHNNILRQYQLGTPCKEIAARYGLTVSAIHLVINKYCRENGMESPKQKMQKSNLRILKRRILDVADTYRGKSTEICRLLESAAEAVGQAQNTAKNQKQDTTKQRNTSILSDYHNGVSRIALASQYGLQESTISTIIQEAKRYERDAL